MKSSKNSGLFPVVIAIVAVLAAPCVFAQGTSFTYQGQLDDAGGPAIGTYDMEFKIWTAPSGGSQAGGTLTDLGIALDNGLFTVNLDFGAGIFNGPPRWLEVGVQTNGGGGFTTLSPRTRFTSAPYAITAATVPGGSIGSAQVTDGSLTASDLSDNTIGGGKLTPVISLGDSSTAGRLNVYYNSSGSPSIRLDGVSSEINTYGSDGLEQNTLGGADWGKLILRDATPGNATTVRLKANDSSGGTLALLNTNQAIRAYLSGANTGGELVLYAEDGTSTINIQGDDGGAGTIRVRNDLGVNGVEIDGSDTFYGAGQILVNESDGSSAVEILGVDGGFIGVNAPNGDTKVWIDGTGAYDGGDIYLRKAGVGAGNRLKMYGAGANGAGGITIMDTDGDETVLIQGAESPTQGAKIILNKADGTTAIVLEAEYAGNGRIITEELEITGGSDLSEQFDVADSGLGVQPGMLVSIDPENPGKLIVSTKAYDRTVAGIVSGAGGVKPGMLMGQRGTVADGALPVALSGRVYCMVDASQGAIEPGDLITTSSVPGHGMKVRDHSQALGAIIGKAMTPLAEGQGTVLILVSLQ